MKPARDITSCQVTLDHLHCALRCRLAAQRVRVHVFYALNGLCKDGEKGWWANSESDIRYHSECIVEEVGSVRENLCETHSYPLPSLSLTLTLAAPFLSPCMKLGLQDMAKVCRNRVANSWQIINNLTSTVQQCNTVLPRIHYVCFHYAGRVSTQDDLWCMPLVRRSEGLRVVSRFVSRTLLNTQRMLFCSDAHEPPSTWRSEDSSPRIIFVNWQHKNHMDVVNN